MRAVVGEYADLSEPRNVSLISAMHGLNEFFSIAIPPIIPFLVTDLDISYAQAGLLLSVFFVMYSLFQLPAGVLADRLGKKPILVAGMFGLAGGVALAGTAYSYEVLVLAMVVSGVSGSTFHPTGMSLVSDYESKATEGKAMGVFGFGGMLGIATAPLLIGGVAGLLDWRIALYAAAAFGVLVTLVFVVFFDDTSKSPKGPEGPEGPENPDDAAVENHNPGRTAHEARTDGIPSRAGVRARLQGRLEAVFHIPVTGAVVLLLVATFLVSLQTRAIFTFTTAYVFTATGQTVTLSNVVFFVMLVAGSISSLVSGSLADRFNRGRLGMITAALTAVLLIGTFVFVEVTGTVSDTVVLGVLMGLFFVIGMAMYAAAPIKNSLISQHAEQEFSGSLFGVMQTVGATGSASGPAILGVLATEVGIVAAYPLIALVSVGLAVVFLLLARAARRSEPRIQPVASD